MAPQVKAFVSQLDLMLRTLIGPPYAVMSWAHHPHNT